MTALLSGVWQPASLDQLGPAVSSVRLGGALAYKISIIYLSNSAFSYLWYLDVLLFRLIYVFLCPFMFFLVHDVL